MCLLTARGSPVAWSFCSGLMVQTPCIVLRTEKDRTLKPAPCGVTLSIEHPLLPSTRSGVYFLSFLRDGVLGLRLTQDETTIAVSA